jgi:hypothetical protein
MGELAKDRAARYARAMNPDFAPRSLRGTMTSAAPADTIKRPPMGSPAPASAVAAAGGPDPVLDAPATTPANAEDAAMVGENAPDSTVSSPAADTSLADQNATGDADINATYARINQLMLAQPDVDYEGKYRQILAQAQKQPVPQAPGRAQSFFAALGSPDQAPGLLAQAHSEQQRASDEKFQKIMSLKEAILHGDIQQQIAKGDFKKAMVQSSELEKLHAHQERQARQDALTTFGKQQDILQGNRLELAHIHEDAATARAEKLIQNRKDLANLSSSAKSGLSRAYVTSYTSLMATGMYTDEQATKMSETAVDQAYEIMKLHGEGGGSTTGSVNPNEGKTRVKRNGQIGWVTKPLPTDVLAPLSK